MAACSFADDAPAACEAGEERCDCYGNGTCNAGLQCLSDLCVVADSSSSAGHAGQAGAGASGESGAQAGGSEATGDGGVASEQAGSAGTTPEEAAGAAGTGAEPPPDCGEEPCEAQGDECGDGELGPGEMCDDGNAVSGDGCNEVCSGVEDGFACLTPGEACTRGEACGNGDVEDGEECDDGNLGDGDGCSASCNIEDDFDCSASPSQCVATSCGDGNLDSNEGCDDGNNVPLDGCSADCELEPCTGSVCDSTCGDGVVSDEECDDGNLRDGDGCASDCTVEDGFVCETTSCDLIGGRCAWRVPAVFRDFNASTSVGGHPDFQPGYDSTGAKGLVETTLDEDGKPVLSDTASVDNGFMHGTDYFAEWYRDVPGVNATIPGEIVLWDTGGGFATRWGKNGEQWVGYPDTLSGEVEYCSSTDCSECSDPPTGKVCLDDCIPWDLPEACYAIERHYDGDPLFFPIDPPTPGILDDSRYPARVPEEYGFYGYPLEADIASRLGLPDPADHNFHFTTEVRMWFRHSDDSPMQLVFTGDDDVWIFVNGELAVDLGGWHPPLSGSVTLDAASAASFGISDGDIFEIAVFHAERETDGSSFQISIAGRPAERSVCVPE